MAVGFDAVGPSSSGATSTGATTLSWSHTVGASGTYLLVAATCDFTPDAGFSMTAKYNGVLMTSLSVVHTNATNAGFLQVWGMANPPTGSALTVLITLTGGTPQDLTGGSLSFTGAGLLSAVQTATGSSAAESLSFSPTTAGNMVAGFCGCGSALTISGSFTNRFTAFVAGGAGAGGIGGATLASTGSAMTPSWTSASDFWAVIAVEVQPAAAVSVTLPGTPPLPPGWFPGSDQLTTQPRGIPFWTQPAPNDPGIPVLPLAPPPPPVLLPVLPPGWFPGADAVATEPGGVPFLVQPQPADPSFNPFVALPPGPQPVPVLGPGWFPGADLLTAEPGDIPFWVCPQPDCSPALPPPFQPFLTSIAGTGTGQYFTDQNGQPYLIHWDSVWGIITQAGSAGGAVTWQSDITNYCAARSAEGFNGFLTTPVSTSQNTGAHVDGSTWDNVLPFTSPGVLNNTFWLRVDYLLSTAASYGMTVLLDTMYTYAITTSGGPLNTWTTGQFQSYGAAVGARYAATPNLVWHFGDDNLGNGNDANFSAFLTGIRGAGANQLVSIENSANSTSRKTLDGATTYAWGTANAQYNYCYGYNAAYDNVETAYLEASPLCVVQMDGWYDNGPGGTTEATELFMRKLVWWVLSSGSRGYQYGNNDLWFWPSNAISSGLVSASPGSSYMQPAALTGVLNIFKSLAGWHQLVPDTSSLLVTAGRGTHVAHFSGAASTYTGGNTYVTASITADHSLAVIYNPAAGNTITVNGALLAPGYTATWVDPASGAQTSAGISATYTHASANSAGDPDWLLVLQGNPVTPVAPGIPVSLPLPPGWFPGAAAVTAVPGGIPFAQIPAPTDQNAPGGGALTVNAGLATGTGAAQSPAVAIGANDALATGTGTAQGDDVNGTFTPAAGASAALAAGTGAAQQPVAAIAVNDGLASGTGTAQQPVAAVAANTGLASGTGTAQSPIPAIGVNDTLATGTGTAQPPVAAIAVNDTLATAVGTAQPPVPAVAASDTLAAATGTAQSSVPAIAVNDAAGPALGTGTALQAATTTPALPAPGYPAVLLGPGWFPGADRLAAEPGGIPFWTQPQPADPSFAAGAPLSVSAGLAAGTGTAQSPLAAIGANDTAGPAPGTGTALSPLAAIAVSPVLASGAGAALDATVSIAGGAVSPALETFAFGPFPQIPPGSVIASVTVIINQWQSTASMGAPSYQLWDGTSAQIGATQTGVVSTSPDHEDQATFTGITWSQLGTLRVRTSANQGSSSSGAVAQVGWVSLVVTFTPAGNATAVPALLNAVAGFGLAGVSTGETAPPAVLAATAGFPQCTAGLLAAAALPAVLNAVAAFPQSAVATGQTATPATLNATAAFPAVAILLAASVLPPVILATAGFPQCAVSTGETVPAATLAATATVPQCTAGLLAATALPALLSAAAGFPPAAASGAVNASLAPAILAASAAIPACLVIASSTGPDYAGNAGVLAGGTGTWTGPAGATGPPDPADAAWTVP